ncbi:MAG: electron transfer flavoprotein subunit alpha/FixB family protein [Gammaproteobacteria bacterium]
MTERRRSIRRARRESGRIRRDPRAERLLPDAAEAIARPRRDPRALRRAAPHPASGRLRIDRRLPMIPPAALQPSAAQNLTVSAPARPLRTIDQPACWVLAVPDLDDSGRLTSADRDLLGAARSLADHTGGAVIAVAFGGRDDFGQAGADRLIAFHAPIFQGYAPEPRAQALAALVVELDPHHVLLPDTVTGGGDLGRRLAVLLGEFPATQVQKLTPARLLMRGNGGRSDYPRPPPRVILLAAEAAEPVLGAIHEARPLPTPVLALQTRIRDLGRVAVDANAIPLAEADFIVSAGNGVSDWQAFHEVAKLLGATEGGSRVVCDAGLLPRERQIGASGTLVDPRCYLAFGIAGAPQHLQGIVRCQRVIAVNTDLHADLIKRADLAIVADAQRVMPALAALLREQGHAG